jgi:hypothetical protein
MIRNILLGLAAGVIFTACHAFITRDKPLTDFEYVCEAVRVMYNVGCGELEPPIVVYSKIIQEASRGQWRGVWIWYENYVFVDPDLDDEQKHKTTLHEISHYVLHNLGLVEIEDTCEHERVARLISGGNWGDSVRRIYGCPLEGS